MGGVGGDGRRWEAAELGLQEWLQSIFQACTSHHLTEYSVFPFTASYPGLPLVISKECPKIKTEGVID